jgi:DNA-binding transcriptional LysR family regulator
MPAADLQLDWLRAFVAVVDAGSLTAAAPQVHRSQSALSMQLKKLEDAVGRAVLTRGPRHLQLTPTGLELLGHARRMLELHGEAQAAIQGARISGQVRLGVPDDYAIAYLTPVLRSFATRHAGVEIALVCEQSTLLIPKVQRGELDLAVVTRDKPQRGTLLFHEPLVWVGAAQHEVWRREPLPIAVYEPGSLARRYALAALVAYKRHYRIVYNS